MVKKADKMLTTRSRLYQLYMTVIVPELMTELKVSNLFEVPKLDKIVINSGLGKSKDDKKVIDAAVNTLTKITGQAPVPTMAKKSIASFKLREGNQIGIKVTLRKDRMYDFLDRLINIVLPRLRDFHGVSVKAFDKQGNYSLGLVDQSVFPELTFDETIVAHGLQVNFVFKAKNPEHNLILLKKFGMPFEKEIK